MTINQPPPFLLRAAVAENAAELATFAECTFRETFAAFNRAEDMDQFCTTTYAPPIQRAEIIDPAQSTLLATSDGQLIGYVQVHLHAPRNDLGNGAAAELRRLYVDTAWHGRGVAVALLDSAVSIAREAGIRQLWLGVWEHNPRAQAFYARHGFKPFGEHVFMVGSDAQRDLLWVRELTEATPATKS